MSASADGAVTTPPSVAASLRASRIARWRSIHVSKPATSVKRCMKFSRRNSPSTTIGRSWRSCAVTSSWIGGVLRRAQRLVGQVAGLVAGDGVHQRGRAQHRADVVDAERHVSNLLTR